MRKRLLTRLLATGSVLLCGTQMAMAQALPYTQKFNTADDFATFTVIDGNRDGSTFKYDDMFRYAVSHHDNAADDYLVTPRFALSAARTYKLSFRAAIPNFFPNETLEVLMGQEPTVAGLATVLKGTHTVDGFDDTTTSLSIEFTVPADGNYCFAIHNTTAEANGDLAIDDIVLEELVTKSVPGAVTALTAEAAAEGALSATIALTAPTTDVDGNAVAGPLTVEVKRNGELVKQLTDVQPGAALQFTDAVPQSGQYAYTVAVSNADGVGAESSVSVYVGSDIPAAPANVRLVFDESKKRAQLTWDAPTTGANGGYVNPAEMTYEVRQAFSSMNLPGLHHIVHRPAPRHVEPRNQHQRAGHHLLLGNGHQQGGHRSARPLQPRRVW